MTVIDNYTPEQLSAYSRFPDSFAKLKQSSLENWESVSYNPSITIDFDEQVTIENVILKPAFSSNDATSDFFNNLSALEEPSSGPIFFRSNDLSQSNRIQAINMVESLKKVR